MGWFIGNFSSSIGKKQVMALTGFLFCSFVALHLFGNLSIYGGKDFFGSYAEHLHSLGVLINLAELGLLISALFHVALAALLYFENLRARPIRYVMKKNAGGRTLSSLLMPYTGAYLIFFVLIHLLTFHFVEHTPENVYDLVKDVFSSPCYVVFYVFSMVVVAIHVKHGFWSAFQTLGANHGKYMPFIRFTGLALSLLIGVGFSSIPLFVFSRG